LFWLIERDFSRMSADDDNQEQKPIDKRSADIAIVCSHRAEIAPFLGKLDRQRKYTDNGSVFRGGFFDETIRMVVVEAGAGFAQHRNATQTLVDEHHPLWILAVGFSSSLTSDIGDGDICLANEISDTHGNTLPVKCSIPESKRVFIRKHVVADTHPATSSDRKALHEQSAAAVVDTTSLAVAQVCQTDGQTPAARFLSIRAVLGHFTDDLSQDALADFEPLPERQPSIFQKVTQRFRPDAALAARTEARDNVAVNLNRYLLGIIEQLGRKIETSR